MRYVMKQKWFALSDSYVIQDERKRDAFYVKGKVFSCGDKLSFQDSTGEEVAYISQRLLSWGPTYDLYRSGKLYATVKKKLFTLFRAKFEVDIPGPNDLEASGDFLDHEYAFTRGSDAVANVSKRWFSWTDTYGIDVESNEDDVLILASAVIIDLACHSKRND